MNIKFILFNGNNVDDFFFYKRMVEDDAATDKDNIERRNLQDFFEFIHLTKSSYFNHEYNLAVPFGTYKKDDDLFIFYISNDDKLDESFRKDISEMLDKGISFDDLYKQPELVFYDYNEIKDKNHIYMNNKLVYVI